MNDSLGIEKIKDLNEYSALREKIKDLLQKEEYGYFPPKPDKVWGEVLSVDKKINVYKAVYERINVHFTVKGKQFTVPVNFCYPLNKKSPLMIEPNFFDEMYNKYTPVDEITDRGYAVATFCHNNVSKDLNDDWTDNLSLLTDRSKKDGCGKLVLWAYAAMRVLDYLSTRPEIDVENVGVTGHSRLGIVALLVGAFDERFTFTHSNCSGTCGSALFSGRTKESESIKQITEVFHCWFSHHFNETYVDKEREMPFDQDYLVGLIAPRAVQIGSASEDLWANPVAEFGTLKKASKIWSLYGYKKVKNVKEFKLSHHYGNGICDYFVRAGKHFFAREDWKLTLDVFDKNLKKEGKTK